MANDMLGIYVNLSNMAAAQWLEFNFKSMCCLGDTCIGANSDGLFSLGDADTDQYIDTSDEGDEIESCFELITTDLGIPNQKRLRKTYIGHESDGELETVIKFDEETTGKTYSFSPEGTENRQRSAVVNNRRDQKGRYFTLRIQNTNGCDYSINSMDVTFNILGNKPSGS